MQFVSTLFLLFFVLVFVGFWLLRRWPFPRNLWLLGASLVFYATWSLDFFWILLGVIAVTYLFGRLTLSYRLRRYKNLLLIIGLALLLGALGLFKYYEFFRASTVEFLGLFGLNAELPLVRLLMPVGLSFYVFRAISYLVDCFKRKVSVRYSPIAIALYIAFFPQVLSGPIMRAEEFVVQTREVASEARINWEGAMTKILAGLFKKVVIASYLQTTIVDDFFAVPQNASGLVAGVAILAYTFQIYMDFSGYTDIAIGLSELLGIRSPINFSQPYCSISPGEFWKRWHITLSSWLRDYLYIPLGGNRKGKLRKYLNLMITMLLGGLWHGAGWQFIAWGGFHGLGLIVTHVVEDIGEKLGLAKDSAKAGLKVLTKWILKPIAWAFTFVFVACVWVFFRASSFSNAIEVFKAFFRGGLPKHGIELYLLITIMACFVLQFIGPWLRQKYETLLKWSPLFLKLIVLTATAIIILKIGPDIVPPFIYFKF